MAHVGGTAETWHRTPTAVRRRIAALGVVGVLAVAVLNSAAGAPEWLHASHVTIAVLLLAGGLIVGRSVFAADRQTVRDPRVIALQLALLVGLLAVTYRSRTPAFVWGVNRTGETWLVFGGLLLFCILAGDPREYSPVQWLVIGCVATVVGIFFHHSLSVAEVSTRSRHPVWSGFIMAVGLIVIPQYLSREQFCWALSRLAAVLVLLTLPVYVVGEFSLYGLRFTFHDGYTIPLLEHEVRATRSLFVNRNAFALVVFAGMVAALGEVHRSLAGRRPTALSVVPGVLLGVNALGLAIAFGRALWVITPMVLGIYLLSLVDRRLLPLALVGGVAYLFAGIYLVHTGRIPLPEGTPTRAENWYPSIAAVLDQESLIGRGLVNPSVVIDAYDPNAGSSPHNSYLSIAIQTGIAGGLAYAGLVVAGVLQAMARYRSVDVAVVALAVGVAAHQIFEAYTMFGWWSSSVLAALVIGSLVFGYSESVPSTTAGKSAGVSSSLAT